MDEIYLDHNATTPLLPEVTEAIRAAHAAGYANPSSQHGPGRRARRRLEEARARVLELLGGATSGRRPDRLIITSGGTESNNHALRGAVGGPVGAGPPPHLIVSAVDHPSITGLADQLAREGVAVDRLAAGPDGVARVDRLEELLRPETRLVSVVLGASETGVVQPIEQIVRVCAARGVPVHTDATQAVGKTPVDFQALGVAMLTFAAHKFHGPRGVGGLIVRGDVAPAPLLYGQAGAERPGTPAVELAVGLQTALEAWDHERDQRLRRVTQLRDQFERLVLQEDAHARLIGSGAQRLPHTSCVSFVGLDRQVLQMALDRDGVACSTGSACASGSSEPSPALVAMGLDEAVVRGALRFSLGATTTAAEAAEAARRISLACKRLRARHEA